MGLVLSAASLTPSLIQRGVHGVLGGDVSGLGDMIGCLLVTMWRLTSASIPVVTQFQLVAGMFVATGAPRGTAIPTTSATISVLGSP